MKEKIALLLGASGSVGSALLQVLLGNSAYQKVVVFVRKPISNITSNKLIQKPISEMTPANLSKAVSDVLTEFSTQNPNVEVMGFSALGIGAKTAQLTIEQHREIDVYLNQAFAQALQRSPHVKSLEFLSAMGANPNAKATGSGAAGMPRYARVKGEAEEAVKKYGPKVVNIFRPAIIRGSQHTPKVIDVLAPLIDYVIPEKIHSVSVQQLGQAMVAASLLDSQTSTVYAYPEMVTLISNMKSSAAL